MQTDLKHSPTAPPPGRLEHCNIISSLNSDCQAHVACHRLCYSPVCGKVKASCSGTGEKIRPRNCKDVSTIMGQSWDKVRLKPKRGLEHVWSQYLDGWHHTATCLLVRQLWCLHLTAGASCSDTVVLMWPKFVKNIGSIFKILKPLHTQVNVKQDTMRKLLQILQDKVHQELGGKLRVPDELFFHRFELWDFNSASCNWICRKQGYTLNFMFFFRYLIYYKFPD